MKYLYGYDSEENSYLVENYPWGFRLKTEIRYWVESREGNGQRFCSQTKNPKTGCWCKPKKATYSEVCVIGVEDDTGFIVNTSLNMYTAAENGIKEFVKIHDENLTPFQWKQLHFLMARNDVMKNVTFEIRPSVHGPVSLLSNTPEDIEKRRLISEEQDRCRREQAIIHNRISNAIYSRAAALNAEVTE